MSGHDMSNHNNHVTTGAPNVHAMHNDMSTVVNTIVNITAGGYNIIKDHVMDHVMGAEPEPEAEHGEHAHGHNHPPPVFHITTDDIILFKQWKLSPGKVTYLSCLALLVIAILYEGMKTLRTRIGKKCHSVQCERHIWAGNHIIQTLLYVVQFMGGYFVMFAVMTFNVWIVIAVVLGLGIGYFLFDWKDYEHVVPLETDPVKPRACAGDIARIQELQPLNKEDAEEIATVPAACSCDHTLL